MVEMMVSRRCRGRIWVFRTVTVLFKGFLRTEGTGIWKGGWSCGLVVVVVRVSVLSAFVWFVVVGLVVDILDMIVSRLWWECSWIN